MDSAVFYHRSNGIQRRDAKQVLDEFGHLLQWRQDQQDSLLDVGCGCGDVTIDYILPLMPKNFSRLIGADLSEEMIYYARENYQTTKISFQTIDISNSNEIHNNSMQFDHLTSFYCLHWVQNQLDAMRNIYNLLLPHGGDCLVAFLASNPIFEIYSLMAKHNKWAEYMIDLDRYISPYQYSDDPGKECERLLYLAGFRDYTVYIRNKNFFYRDKDTLKKAVKAVNPFLKRIPKELHDDYLEEYVNIASQLLWNDEKRERENRNFLFSYKLIIFYARK